MDVGVGVGVVIRPEPATHTTHTGGPEFFAFAFPLFDHRCARCARAKRSPRLLLSITGSIQVVGWLHDNDAMLCRVLLSHVESLYHALLLGSSLRISRQRRRR
jgi:hypothetical protein